MGRLLYEKIKMVSTESKDLIIRRMVDGPGIKRTFPWNSLRLLGYDHVQIDRVYSESELGEVEWNKINNTLLMKFYAKYLTHRIADPEKAIDPTAKILKGFVVGKVNYSVHEIMVARKDLGLGFYHISFAKMLQWKNWAYTNEVFRADEANMYEKNKNNIL